MTHMFGFIARGISKKINVPRHRVRPASASQKRPSTDRMPFASQHQREEQHMTRLRTRITAILLGSITAVALAGGASAMTLRASHQFPGGKGDVRDDMVQMIAKEAKAAN